MVNYQQGKIYKIVCHNTGLVYYGSTCVPTLARRLQEHKGSYKRGRKCTSTKILESGNFGIFLVENCPCHNKDELRMRERFHIENNECVNKIIPIRFEGELRLLKSKRGKEYYQKNKQLNQIYSTEKKIKIADYQKKYREAKKNNREYQKQYSNQEEVRLKIREADRRYREANKEIIRDLKKRWYDKKKVKAFFLNFLKCFDV